MSLTLKQMVADCRDSGVIDPRLVAERIADIVIEWDRSELVSFISSALPDSVRVAYSRERLGLPKKAAQAARSGKVAMIRDYYGSVIGLPSGEWKRIGDCTRLDLIDYSGMLETHAHRTLEKARWYRSLAEQLPDDGTTVEQAGLKLGRAA